MRREPRHNSWQIACLIERHVNQAAFQHLWPLLERNRPVAIHNHLIRLTGSTKAAVFLSQLVYWTRRSPSARACGGWLHKTSAEWFRELGLSRREQESARAILKALDILDEALFGQPALRYYCLKLPQLGHLLTAHVGQPIAEFDLEVLCSNETLVRELLGRAVPYHRKLAYLTDSVNAGLLLTRLIYQHRRHLHAQGWSRLSREELERELGLTRWEQETARERLRTRRFVEERMACLPARLYARVVPPIILDALQRLDANLTSGSDSQPARRKSANPIVGIPAFLKEEKRQPESRHSRESGGTKTADLLGAMPRPSLAKNHLSNSTQTTTVNLTTGKQTTTTSLPPESIAPLSPCSEVVVATTDEPDPTLITQGVDRLTVRQPPSQTVERDSAVAATSLIFPTDFLPAERELAASELADLSPERAQMVLDELEGRTRKGRRVDSRVGLVRSLARAEREGRFTPAFGWEVKAGRERAAQLQAERQARQQEDADAMRLEVSAQASGKTGYEAFKALSRRWRRSTSVGQIREADKNE